MELRSKLSIESSEPDLSGSGPGGVDDKSAEQKPAFVTSDEFKRFTETINSTLSSVNEALGLMRQSAVAHQQTLPPNDEPKPVSDEQFEQAVRDGDATTIRQYFDHREHKLRKERIDPLEAIGLSSIAELTRQTVSEKLPHYKRYKKEIDEYVDGLPPAVKVNPLVYRRAYETVVGQHVDELIAEGIEAMSRRAVQDPAQAGAPGSGGRVGASGKASDAVPGVEELLGKNEADALAFKGMNADSFARRLGYSGWAEYAKLIVDQGDSIHGR